LLRLTNFSEEEHEVTKQKGDYISHRLPQEALAVGQYAEVVGYWLYPILVVSFKRCCVIAVKKLD